MQTVTNNCQKIEQCRTCLETENDFVDIFDEGLQEVLEIFIDIQVTPNDYFPKHICIKCAAILKGFVEFKEICKRSNEYFNGLECYNKQIHPTDYNDSAIKLESIESPNQVLKIEYDGDTNYGNDIKSGSNDPLKISNLTNDPFEVKCEPIDLIGDYSLNDSSVPVNQNGVPAKWQCDDLKRLSDFKSINKLISDVNRSESSKFDGSVSNEDESTEEESNDSKKVTVKRKKSNVQAEKPARTSRMDVVDPTKIEKIRLSLEEQKTELLKRSQSNEYIKALFKCRDCFKHFDYEDCFTEHRKKRHDESIGSFVCPLCAVRFKAKGCLQSHVYKHSLVYRCVQCDVKYATGNSARQHYKSAHEGIKPTLVCHLCGNVSRSKCAHLRHLKLTHGNAEKIQCPECPAAFVEKQSFKNHMRMHTGLKQFKCDMCEAAFSHRGTMLRHRLTHSADKNFHCQPCDISFKCEEYLTSHLKISPRHGGKKQKMNCVICRASFDQKSELTKHKASEHGVKPAPKVKTKKRNHQCDTCGKAFSAKIILKDHIRTHTGERPFSCGTCGSSFAQKSAMRTHVKLVHLNVKRNAVAKNRTKGKEENAHVTVSQELHIDD